MALVKCVGCGKNLSSGPHQAGEVFNCPMCSTANTVPPVSGGRPAPTAAKGFAGAGLFGTPILPEHLNLQPPAPFPPPTILPPGIPFLQPPHAPPMMGGVPYLLPPGAPTPGPARGPGGVPWMPGLMGRPVVPPPPIPPAPPNPNAGFPGIPPRRQRMATIRNARRRSARNRMRIHRILSHGAHRLAGMAQRGIGVASPMVSSTFQGSVQMLEASLARPLLPFVDKLSGLMQRLSKFTDNVPKELVGGLSGAAIGAAAGYRLGGATGALTGSILGAGVGAGEGAAGTGAALGLWAGAKLGASYGRWGGPVGAAIGAAVGATAGHVMSNWDTASYLADKDRANGVGYFRGLGRFVGNLFSPDEDDRKQKGKDDLLRNYGALPHSRAGLGGMEYYDLVSQGAQNLDPLDANILREQLRYMKQQGTLLEDIGDDIEGLRHFVPSFR